MSMHLSISSEGSSQVLNKPSLKRNNEGFEVWKMTHHMEECLHYKHTTHLVSPLLHCCIMMYVHHS